MTIFWGLEGTVVLSLFKKMLTESSRRFSTYILQETFISVAVIYLGKLKTKRLRDDFPKALSQISALKDIDKKAAQNPKYDIESLMGTKEDFDKFSQLSLDLKSSYRNDVWMLMNRLKR